MLSYCLPLALGASICGAYLNARRSALCFPVWLGSYAYWIGEAISRDAHGQIFLFTIYGVTAIYGWRSWRRQPEGSEQAGKRDSVRVDGKRNVVGSIFRRKGNGRQETDRWQEGWQEAEARVG